MTGPRTFLAAFDAAIPERDRRFGTTPDDHLAAWQQIIDWVADCYRDNFYEYRNDLYIRELIEKMLAHPDLAEYAELADFRQRVDELDERFRALLRPGPTEPAPDLPWWKARIPARAGAELAQHYRDHHGLTIEVCE
ncbi:hypothetical protein ACPZ19_21800 [Amycolatopsis lurida]